MAPIFTPRYLAENLLHHSFCFLPEKLWAYLVAAGLAGRSHYDQEMKKNREDLSLGIHD
jgi:hypothetical protein